MELQSITDYVNITLKNQLKFKEKYYLHVETERNLIQIKTLFPLVEGNLFQILRSDKNMGRNFIENILNILQEKDKHILLLNVSIDVLDDHPMGFSIVSLRDETLQNELEIFPEEIVKYIVSMCDIKDIKNFGTTCKQYRNVIINDNFWMMKCSHIFNINICEFKENINYKGLLKYYHSLDDTEVKKKSFNPLSDEFVENYLYIKFLIMYKKYCNYDINSLINNLTKISTKNKELLDKIIILIKLIGDNYNMKNIKTQFKSQINNFLSKHNQTESIKLFL